MPMERTALPIDGSSDQRDRILNILAPYGAGALAVAARFGARIVVLHEDDRYSDRSPVLRRIGAGVDRWPIPPAGLFVVEERTIYLRHVTPMTVAHEFGHALDAALGGGVYRSGIDPVIRRAFAAAEKFVTPYSASSCDEWVAENLRAYVSVNDTHSLWPRATRERLFEVDPRMGAIVKTLFEEELNPAA